MTTTADILRAAAEGPTPGGADCLIAWVVYGNAYRACEACIDANDIGPRGSGILGRMTDCERRAFLILVAETLDHPQEP